MTYAYIYKGSHLVDFNDHLSRIGRSRSGTTRDRDLCRLNGWVIPDLLAARFGIDTKPSQPAIRNPVGPDQTGVRLHGIRLVHR